MEKSTLDLTIQDNIHHTALTIADEIVKEAPADPFTPNNQRTESIKT